MMLRENNHDKNEFMVDYKKNFKVPIEQNFPEDDVTDHDSNDDDSSDDSFYIEKGSGKTFLDKLNLGSGKFAKKILGSTSSINRSQTQKIKE